MTAQDGGRVSKREFVARVARSAGVSVATASQVYEALVDEVVAVVAEGNRLTLRGFGKFYPQDHKGHRVRFADGSPDGSGVIPDYSVLKFSATRDVNRRLGAPTQGRASP